MRDASHVNSPERLRPQSQLVEKIIPLLRQLAILRIRQDRRSRGTELPGRAFKRMEYILRHLPRKPRLVAVRIGVTTALVGLSFALLLVMQHLAGLLGFYVLFPAIFAVSIVFDRACGIYAATLSTLLLYVVLIPVGRVLLPLAYVLPLLGFAAIAVAFALVSDALRRAWERAATAEQAKDLLLKELAHRTKNNLMMVVSLLLMQARLKSNPETRQALEKAADRIQAIASAHEHFQPVEHEGRVEMSAYLEKLCAHLADALRDVRPITVKVEAAKIHLPAEKAVPLGLIVNELVTNALKHAFPADRPGTIRVALSRASGLTLLVSDDGVGRSKETKQGMGTRLVRLLAEQLGAELAWDQSDIGCQVSLEIRGVGEPLAR
jgi:two-component sensor histidine kinase